MDSTVTGKNQVTIPASVARALGVRRGSRLSWTVDPSTRVAEVRVLPDRAALAAEVRGFAKGKVPPGSDPIAELIREREADQAERA